MNSNTPRYTSINREGNTVVYSVPVIRHVWKEKKHDASYLIIEKIRKARSEAEVNALVERGIATHPDFEKSVIDKWKKNAEKKIQSLRNNNPPKEK